ncbi:MAG TPA: hypothetical protein VIU14_08330 [Mesorhizobium sp.]
MKAVVDEGVPRRLALLLREHDRDVSNFPRDWRGLTNGKLLQRMKDSGFECLLTCDRNIHHQQTISAKQIGLIVLPAQRFEDIEPYAPAILSALDSIEAGMVIEIPKNATSSSAAATNANKF